MKKCKNLLIILSSVLCLSIFCYSSVQVYDILKSYREEQQVYEQIDTIIDNANNETSKEDWFEFYDNRELIKIDQFKYSLQKMKQNAWQALYNENNDFIAYLWFDNDLFKEPIMQTTNNSYYLNHDFNKKYFVRGSVFMNYVSELDDTNITIYGHNNTSDYSVKFARLNDMKDDENLYYENAHFSIYFENEIRRYVICYIFVNKDFVNYNHQFRTLTKEEFNNYFNFVKSKNTVPSIQEIEYGDKFVTLQTCLRSNGKYKVMAIAKEIGRYSYK